MIKLPWGMFLGKSLSIYPRGVQFLHWDPSDGDLADILHATCSGSIYDHADQEGIYSFLKKCLNSREEPWEINDAALFEYERPRLAGRLAALFNRLTEPNS